MRRDLIHTPSVKDNAATCSDCGCWLPLDASESALKAPGAAVLEVGGLGAFCVTIRSTLGREAIVCSHPSVKAQAREITVAQCEQCAGMNPDCEMCGGSGMIGIVPDPDNPENPQILKVSAGGLDDAQLQREGLQVERIPATTDFEKRVSSNLLANWIGLREQIRAEMTDGT